MFIQNAIANIRNNIHVNQNKIDDHFEHKLISIQQGTDLNTSEIIKQSINLFYKKLTSINKK